MVISAILLIIGASPRGDEEKEGRVDVTFKKSINDRTTTIIHSDDWRWDQYQWSNQGVAKLPGKGPKVRKHYFHADTPKGFTKAFQRHAYQLMDNENKTLIHYLGG